MATTTTSVAADESETITRDKSGVVSLHLFFLFPRDTKTYDSLERHCDSQQNLQVQAIKAGGPSSFVIYLFSGTCGGRDGDEHFCSLLLVYK